MYTTASKITDEKTLVLRLAGWRLKDKQIVFTNGCFDLLHPGHADYLEKARRKGDILIVGLNSDSSIQRIKAANRPVMKQEARARLLAAMEFVDMVVIFEEDTPERLIGVVQPDILVKGADYKPEEIVGNEIVTANGGKVETVELMPGYSSSLIIEKIQTL